MTLGTANMTAQMLGVVSTHGRLGTTYGVGMPDTADALNPWAVWLSTEMKRAKVSQKQLAESVGVHRTTVWEWTRGKVRNVSAGTAEQVAAAIPGASRDAALAAAAAAANDGAGGVSPSPTTTGGPVPAGFGRWLQLMRVTSGYVTPGDLARAVSRTPADVEAWEAEETQPEPIDIQRLSVALTDVPRWMLLRAAGYLQPRAELDALQDWLDDPTTPEASRTAVLEVIRMASKERTTG